MKRANYSSHLYLWRILPSISKANSDQWMRPHVLVHNSYTKLFSSTSFEVHFLPFMYSFHLKHIWIFCDNICECKEDLFQCFMACVFRMGYWVMILHILKAFWDVMQHGGTDVLSLNANNQLLTYVTQHPRRVKASTTPQQKPEISLHNIAGGYQHLRTTNWLHLQGWSD